MIFFWLGVYILRWFLLGKNKDCDVSSNRICDFLLKWMVSGTVMVKGIWQHHLLGHIFVGN